MKPVFLLLFGFVTLAHAQNQARTDTTHAMLMPDANTIFLDEHLRPMTGQQFSDSVEAGHFTFKPVVEGGRLKSMQLVRVTGNLQAGARMPDFVVKDIHGRSYSLAELKGKTLVLNFWFTGCMPCRSEMPELNALTEKYSTDKNIVFLALTFNDAETVYKFLETTAFKYDIVPGQADLLKQFGIASYPTNAIVDKTGKVAFMLSSYSPDNIKKLGRVLEMISGI